MARRTFHLLSVAMLLLAQLWCSIAGAQSAPPDVVRLRNGGMLRGTLVENIPGDHVTLQLVTGELRTFPASEVLAVEPALPEAPSAVRPVNMISPGLPVAPQLDGAPNVRLRVTSEAEGLSLHRLSGTATSWGSRGGALQIEQFAFLCNAPCDLTIPAGSYTFGVAHGTQPTQRAEHGNWAVQRDTQLALEYEDRSGLRAAGWVSLLIGTLVGAPIAILSIGASDSTVRIGGMITGGVVFIAGGIAFLALVTMGDIQDIREIQDGVRF